MPSSLFLDVFSHVCLLMRPSRAVAYNERLYALILMFLHCSIAVMSCKVYDDGDGGGAALQVIEKSSFIIGVDFLFYVRFFMATTSAFVLSLIFTARSR